MKLFVAINVVVLFSAIEARSEDVADTESTIDSSSDEVQETTKEESASDSAQSDISNVNEESENDSELQSETDSQEGTIIEKELTQSLDTPPESVIEDDMMSLDLETLLDTPIEVWSATKTKQTLDEAPAIVTVITKEEIINRGYRSLAEILKYTLGFYIIDDYTIPNLGIRGVAGGFMGESGTVKIMIDGRSTAFRSTGGNWIGPELIPLTAVERIEIIRGPASALYGADAFLGIVNVITVNGAEQKLGRIQLSGMYNSLSNLGHDLDFTVGTRRKNFEIMLSGRSYAEDFSGLKLPSSSPSPEIPPYKRDDRTATNLKSISHSAHGKLAYHLGEKNTIRLMGYFSGIERGGEFSSWSQLSNGLDAAGHTRGTTIALFKTMTGLDFDSQITEDFSLKFRISYLQGKPGSKDRIDTGNDIFYIKRDFGYQALETSLESAWNIRKDLTAVVGAEFIYDWEKLPSSLSVLRSSNNDVAAGEIQEISSTRQGNLDLYNLGAFAQLSWSGLKPYIYLTSGLRYDYHSIYGNKVSGRAGLTSNPHKILFLKVLYGSAFKAPSPLLLYGTPYETGDIVGNPELKPQIVHTVEGQVTLKPWSFFSASTGLAYNKLKDKAEFVQRGINRFADNMSKMQGISWESEIAAEYKEHLAGKISFELQNTKREFDTRQSAYLSYLVGNRNVIYPSYIMRADLSGRLPKLPLRIGASLMLAGDRPSSEMNSIENLNMYELPPYLLLDATISTVGLELVGGRETAVSLIGRNLTNRNTPDPGFAGVDYPLQPLTIMLQLRQEL